MATAISDSPPSSSSSANSSPIMSPSSAIQQTPTPNADEVVVLMRGPCAACKTLRRRCVPEKCVFAPYFPPTDPHKFTIAHKVFGASNIIKLLQEIPENQRADAVNSMVYEGNARIKDPIYGCAGAISQLQHQINELQAELAKSKAEILNLQSQNHNLVSMISNLSTFIMQGNHQEMFVEYANDQQLTFENTNMLIHEDGNLYDAWGPRWT